MKNFMDMTSEEMTKEIKQNKLIRISCDMQNVFTRSGYCQKYYDLERHFQYVKENGV